jgi:hypothetical protein
MFLDLQELGLKNYSSGMDNSVTFSDKLCTKPNKKLFHSILQLVFNSD